MKIILRIKRKPATNEWLVTVEMDGKHAGDLTYFTDDEQDALDTRVAMANRLESKGHTVTLV